jgi:hypothetical protein
MLTAASCPRNFIVPPMRFRCSKLSPGDVLHTSFSRPSSLAQSKSGTPVRRSTGSECSYFFSEVPIKSTAYNL